MRYFSHEQQVASEKTASVIRERLQKPRFQRKFVYVESGVVSRFDSTIGTGGSADGLSFGPTVVSRVYNKAFWVAPKSGLMDKPWQMTVVLEEISRELFCYKDDPKLENGRLTYGRVNFWKDYNLSLAMELVALPHKYILEMLSGYHENKDAANPFLGFEDKDGLDFSISAQQLRALKEHDKQIKRELRAEHVPAWIRNLGSRLHSKER